MKTIFPFCAGLLVIAASVATSACGGEIDPNSVSAPLAGSAPPSQPPDPTKPNVTIPGGTATEIEGEFRALAVDAEWTYLIDTFARVVRIPKAGGSAETLHPPEGGYEYPGGLVVDDGFLYWTTLGFKDFEGRVIRMPKAGGSLEVIADKQPRPWGLAIDEGHVYWANEGLGPNISTHFADRGDSYKDGSIARVPKIGGDVEILTMQPRAISIALDAEAVYFATGPDGSKNGTIGRVLKKPGAGAGAETKSNVLVDRRGSILSMAVDDGRVVWIEEGVVSAVPVGGGSVVELQNRSQCQHNPRVSQGLAAGNGTVYFGVGSSSASLVARAQDGSTRDVEKMTLPSDANAFIARSIAIDTARVYWLDYWWSYSSPKHHSIIRSGLR